MSEKDFVTVGCSPSLFGETVSSELPNYVWFVVKQKHDCSEELKDYEHNALLCMCAPMFHKESKARTKCIFDENGSAGAAAMWRPILVPIHCTIGSEDVELIKIEDAYVYDHWFRPADIAEQTPYDYANPFHIVYEDKPRYAWCHCAGLLDFDVKKHDSVFVGTVGNLQANNLVQSEKKIDMRTEVWKEMLQLDAQWQKHGTNDDFPKELIWRIRGDRYAMYGDGGNNVLHYPIWKKTVNQSFCDRFTQELHNLNDTRNDKHVKEPLDDIIDPNLAPGKFATLDALFEHANPIKKYDNIHLKTVDRASNAYYVQRLLQMEKRYNMGTEDVKSGEHLSHCLRDIAREIQHELEMNASGPTGDSDPATPGTLIRQTMHWIPSRVSIGKNGTARIMSSIHQLPKTSKNANLYRCFEMLLTESIPMLQNLGLGKPLSTLQVIFKAQSYDMRPNSSYKGKWHVEGLTENIVAVISFYAHISPFLSGGWLRFRPQKGPDKYYDSFGTTVDVPIEEGSLVVFSNVLPHRVRRIKCNATTNSTEQHRRTFVTMFIVDPLRPIPSTAKQDKTVIPMCQTHDEAVAFRTSLRVPLSKEKHGWGHVAYGNCGVTQFHRSVVELEANAGCNTDGISANLEHTDSSVS